jgi:Zn-dependent protease with chaperone function
VTPTASPSIVARAVLALLLMAGFYILALGLAAALLWVPYAAFRYLDSVDARLVAFCAIGAGVILWALRPRFDRFQAPGPRLDAARHPRLFAVLRDVAQASGQAMPADVYLVSDINAWVAQRGGLLGVGSRRVMGLGLPLLQTLTVSQLRAVVAHEFGHYHGGDTALGPLIWRTRVALERTMRGVAGYGAWLAYPFLWYGRAFLRVSHAVSRRQEFAADALAARLVGARPLAEGLKIIHGASAAFDPYWHAEVGPAIERGFRPPLAEGFRRFMAVPDVATGVAGEIERALREGTSGPYDTHPPLRERVAALDALAASASGPAPAADAPALSLLDDLEGVERALLETVVRKDLRANLQPARWEELGERVWVPLWREHATARAPLLRGIRPRDFPTWAADLTALAVRLNLAAYGGVAMDTHRRHAAHVCGAALATALKARGWTVSALPGDGVRFNRGGRTLEPFAALPALAAGQMSPVEWLGQCEQNGIAEIDLGAEVAGLSADDTRSAP